MKTFLTAAKEDRRVPYVIAAFAGITTAIMPYVDSVIIVDGVTGAVTTPYGLSIALAASGVCVLVFVITLICLITCRRFEEKQDAKLGDERDRLHEHMISNSGYAVLIVGLSLYTIYTSSVYMVGLLLLALVYRFYLRVRLDTTA